MRTLIHSWSLAVVPALGLIFVAACTATPPPTDASLDAASDVSTGDAASDLGLDALGDSAADALASEAGICPNPEPGTTLPDGAALPDLAVLGERLLTRAQFVYQNFSRTSCDVTEDSCVPAAGCRRLLRFDLVVANVGVGDLYLGPPNAANRTPPTFRHSACSNVYQLIGFAEYDLLDMTGQRVGFGHKQSFCLMDLERLPDGADVPRANRYVCNNQGIHAGWADIYDRSLNCQYVDITDVPPGHYRLRARINVECHLAESDYSNNWGETEIDIPPPADGGGCATNPVAACATTTDGLDRDCGWTLEGTHACMPGASVTVGCDASCSPALGACTGDTMIRVCPGGTPCAATSGLAQNDDFTCSAATTNVCSRVSFTCPESGMYTLLTGAYHSGQAYTCTVAVAP